MGYFISAIFNRRVALKPTQGTQPHPVQAIQGDIKLTGKALTFTSRLRAFTSGTTNGTTRLHEALNYALSVQDGTHDVPLQSALVDILSPKCTDSRQVKLLKVRTTLLYFNPIYGQIATAIQSNQPESASLHRLCVQIAEIVKQVFTKYNVWSQLNLIGDSKQQFCAAIDEAATRLLVTSWKVPASELTNISMAIADEHSDDEIRSEERLTMGTGLLQPRLPGATVATSKISDTALTALCTYYPDGIPSLRSHEVASHTFKSAFHELSLVQRFDTVSQWIASSPQATMTLLGQDGQTALGKQLGFLLIEALATSNADAQFTDGFTLNTPKNGRALEIASLANALMTVDTGRIFDALASELSEQHKTTIDVTESEAEIYKVTKRILFFYNYVREHYPLSPLGITLLDNVTTCIQNGASRIEKALKRATFATESPFTTLLNDDWLELVVKRISYASRSERPELIQKFMDQITEENFRNVLLFFSDIQVQHRSEAVIELQDALFNKAPYIVMSLAIKERRSALALTPDAAPWLAQMTKPTVGEFLEHVSKRSNFSATHLPEPALTAIKTIYEMGQKYTVLPDQTLALEHQTAQFMTRTEAMLVVKTNLQIVESVLRAENIKIPKPIAAEIAGLLAVIYVGEPIVAQMESLCHGSLSRRINALPSPPFKGKETATMIILNTKEAGHSKFKGNLPDSFDLIESQGIFSSKKSTIHNELWRIFISTDLFLGRSKIAGTSIQNLGNELARPLEQLASGNENAIAVIDEIRTEISTKIDLLGETKKGPKPDKPTVEYIKHLKWIKESIESIRIEILRHVYEQLEYGKIEPADFLGRLDSLLRTLRSPEERAIIEGTKSQVQRIKDTPMEIQLRNIIEGFDVRLGRAHQVPTIAQSHTLDHASTRSSLRTLFFSRRPNRYSIINQEEQSPLTRDGDGDGHSQALSGRLRVADTITAILNGNYNALIIFNAAPETRSSSLEKALEERTDDLVQHSSYYRQLQDNVNETLRAIVKRAASPDQRASVISAAIDKLYRCNDVAPSVFETFTTQLNTARDSGPESAAPSTIEDKIPASSIETPLDLKIALYKANYISPPFTLINDTRVLNQFIERCGGESSPKEGLIGKIQAIKQSQANDPIKTGQTILTGYLASADITAEQIRSLLQFGLVQPTPIRPKTAEIEHELVRFRLLKRTPNGLVCNSGYCLSVEARKREISRIISDPNPVEQMVSNRILIRRIELAEGLGLDSFIDVSGTSFAHAEDPISAIQNKIIIGDLTESDKDALIERGIIRETFTPNNSSSPQTSIALQELGLISARRAKGKEIRWILTPGQPTPPAQLPSYQRISEDLLRALNLLTLDHRENTYRVQLLTQTIIYSFQQAKHRLAVDRGVRNIVQMAYGEVQTPLQQLRKAQQAIQQTRIHDDYDLIFVDHSSDNEETFSQESPLPGAAEYRSTRQVSIQTPIVRRAQSCKIPPAVTEDSDNALDPKIRGQIPPRVAIETLTGILKATISHHKKQAMSPGQLFEKTLEILDPTASRLISHAHHANALLMGPKTIDAFSDCIKHLNELKEFYQVPSAAQEAISVAIDLRIRDLIRLQAATFPVDVDRLKPAFQQWITTRRSRTNLYQLDTIQAPLSGLNTLVGIIGKIKVQKTCTTVQSADLAPMMTAIRDRDEAKATTHVSNLKKWLGGTDIHTLNRLLTTSIDVYIKASNHTIRLQENPGALISADNQWYILGDQLTKLVTSATLPEAESRKIQSTCVSWAEKTEDQIDKLLAKFEEQAATNPQLAEGNINLFIQKCEKFPAVIDINSHKDKLTEILYNASGGKLESRTKPLSEILHASILKDGDNAIIAAVNAAIIKNETSVFLRVINTLIANHQEPTFVEKVFSVILETARTASKSWVAPDSGLSSNGASTIIDGIRILQDRFKLVGNPKGPDQVTPSPHPAAR